MYSMFLVPETKSRARLVVPWGNQVGKFVERDLICPAVNPGMLAESTLVVVDPNSTTSWDEVYIFQLKSLQNNTPSTTFPITLHPTLSNISALRKSDCPGN